MRGDGSCPELAEHVHCRNCPVHSAAALTLLDREPPSERGVLPSGPVRGEPPQGDTRSTIVFRLAQNWFALPTLLCREVGRRTRIHRLPDGNRERLLGLANVHGELLVCVSLHRILELDDEDRAKRSRTSRFLVLEHDEGGIVCPVDEACGIAHYHESELGPAPAGKSARSHTKAVFAWHERSVGLLDEKLLQRSFAGSFTSIPI